MSITILPCNSNVLRRAERTGSSVKESDCSYQNCKNGKWVIVLAIDCRVEATPAGVVKRTMKGAEDEMRCSRRRGRSAFKRHQRADKYCA